MGYRDYKLILSNSQRVNADADSTYFLDTEVTNPRWEKNNKFGVIITVEKKVTAGTGVNFIVVHKTSEPTTADADLVTVHALAAHLVVGREIIIPLPNIPLLRYVRLYYNIVAGTEDYTFSAYFTPIPA